MPPDVSLASRLESYRQQQVLQWWDQLSEPERAKLEAEIESIDFAHLDSLINTLVLNPSGEDLGFDLKSAEPPAVVRLPRTDAERSARRVAAERGAAALAAGHVAVVLVAGGQGSRLGFDGPKGCYPIAPVSHASLFQIHAEKIKALGARHGRPIPLFIMTSPENHQATLDYWAKHKNFGLESVRLFIQDRMPAVDRSSGKILLADKWSLALSPSGHGGTLRALSEKRPQGRASCLEEMEQKGVKTIFYFQVDNPMVRIADPGFLGLHLQADAEVSFKVIEKQQPEEKLGLVVEIEGKPRVIEYSDLPSAMAKQRESDGSLSHWAGSIAVHLFEVSFFQRLANQKISLPFHRALKKVPYVNDQGRKVDPQEPNAVKFESFIFDTLPLAERYTLVETDRMIEFEPLKNAAGPDSPQTVRRRMSELFAAWLEASGATVTRDPDGSVPFGIEISPLFAFDAAELKTKIKPGIEVDGPLYLGPETL